MSRRGGKDAQRTWLIIGMLACTLGCEPDREVDVSGRAPIGVCALTETPASVDYGLVPIGATVTQPVVVANQGTDICSVSSLSLAASSDPEFSLSGAPLAAFTLSPGASETVTIAFAATSRATPRLRTGALLAQSNDPLHPNQSVPLSATIDVGCDLVATPNPLNFGNLALNVTQTVPVVLTNEGTRACSVTGLGLAPGTDADFSLAQGQPTALTFQPGASASVPVTFDATSPPPNLRTGALTLTVSEQDNPLISIPLQGYIDTNCTAASQLIYTVESNGELSSFDPDTLTFTDIGPLDCPTNSNTFSMAVDQLAVAWVEYQSGELFRVDTSTAACTATGFQVDQRGFQNFGMGFLFQPNTGVDTLYIAGGDEQQLGSSQLGTISFPGLVVSPIGPISLGWPELTGTGDGQLWGFVPAEGSTSGVATVAQLDPATGKTLAAFTYPQITGAGGWAMKFFGGSFWIFLGNSVYAVSRDTAALTVALDGTSPEVVGAGVSTCAPLQALPRSLLHQRSPGHAAAPSIR